MPDTAGVPSSITIQENGIVQGPSGGNPRVICDDDCASAIIPAGVSGWPGPGPQNVTFDQTNLCRIIAGGNGFNGDYRLPPAALDGPLIFEIYLQFLNNYLNGDFNIGFVRGDSSAYAHLTFEVNGGCIFFNWDGTHAYDAGFTARDPIGQMLRIRMAVNDLIDNGQNMPNATNTRALELSVAEMGLDTTTATGYFGTPNVSTDVTSLATKITPSPALPAGVTIQPIIQAAASRSARIFQTRWRRGILGTEGGI